MRMMRRVLAAVVSAVMLTAAVVVVSPGTASAVSGWVISNYSGWCLNPVGHSPDRNVPIIQDGDPCDSWDFTAGGAGWQHIQSLRAPGRCMVPGGSSTVKNAAIVQATCTTTAAFDWTPILKLQTASHDYYQLRNRNSGLCMAVVGNSHLIGASVLQAPCASVTGQYFTWEPFNS
jgi:hypothetical protein